MPEAYVLINCDLGSEEAIIEELKHVDNISEVHGTFGAYDIIAKLASEKVDSLRQTITWQIRKIANVRSTLTLMGIDGQN
jgi:DNA-binding Lrp family transcriptional regulator